MVDKTVNERPIKKGEAIGPLPQEMVVALIFCLLFYYLRFHNKLCLHAIRLCEILLLYNLRGIINYIDKMLKRKLNVLKVPVLTFRVDRYEY